MLFYSKLSFTSRYREKINKAVLGLIKHNFMYLTEDAIVTLYKSLDSQVSFRIRICHFCVESLSARINRRLGNEQEET